jgi:hexokinase
MTDLDVELRRLEELFSVPAAKLKEVTDHFVKELAKGLSVEGGNIPMNPTWVMNMPDGHEQGTFLALDMGGTNLRVCEITLSDTPSHFSIVQEKYRMPVELKTGDANAMWDYIADCLQKFVDAHHPHMSDPLPAGAPPREKLSLGFTFSYPATQDNIDQGILQRWTKGFDIDGVEGQDVVPLVEAALERRGVPIKITALLNDTTGTLIASAYADPSIKIGVIFGTGCNAAYMENCGSIPKLAHLGLPPDAPMAINCEWGAFDNERVVLPTTPYDALIDSESPRPGQQAFEKMVAGLYLGEIFRQVVVDLHARGVLFAGQSDELLTKPYSLDSSLPAAIEEDDTEDLSRTAAILHTLLNFTATPEELRFLRRLAELIGTRAARLSHCGVAAVAKKKGYASFHVGADGTVFNKYPHFKARGAQALREILDWPDKASPDEEDPIEVHPSEDGSGVGAALAAALTLKRAKAGLLAGILHPQNFLN